MQQNQEDFYSQLMPVSLEDLGTDAQAENIIRLMNSGYSVVAFINQGESHPKVSEELVFESQVMTLLLLLRLRLNQSAMPCSLRQSRCSTR
jgi:hypothetical protein